MTRNFALKDVGLIFTICKYPEFTYDAVSSLEEFYPGLDRIAIDDHCRSCPEHEAVLERIEEDFKIPILRQEERQGAGRAIDRGIRFLKTPLALTVEHGARIQQGGLIEIYLERMADPDILGVGRKRSDKKCNAAFGPYVDPWFALWDREFIVQEDLSFKLTHIVMGDWTVEGCSTGMFLQYRAMRLGKKLGFMSPKRVYHYVSHKRTPRERGRNASPHEAVEVDEDYLIPRRRKADGSLRFPGMRACRERAERRRAGRRKRR